MTKTTDYLGKSLFQTNPFVDLADIVREVDGHGHHDEAHYIHDLLF